MSQRSETKLPSENTLDPVLIKNFLIANGDESKGRNLLELIKDSQQNVSFDKQAFHDMNQTLPDRYKEIPQIKFARSSKTSHCGKRSKQKAYHSINAKQASATGGFTSVLENLRGKHDKYVSARLRSAYITNDTLKGVNTNSSIVTSSTKNNIRVYRETADGVQYESLTMKNKNPILNPTNHKKQNKFGFA